MKDALRRQLIPGGSGQAGSQVAAQGFSHWLGRRLDWSAPTMPINSKTPQLWEGRRRVFTRGANGQRLFDLQLHTRRENSTTDTVPTPRIPASQDEMELLRPSRMGLTSPSMSISSTTALAGYSFLVMEHDTAHTAVRRQVC